MLYFTHVAGIDCMLSASKDGATRERFADVETWAPSADGFGFDHRHLPITVRFPSDEDRVARICVVEATMDSADDQSALTKAFKQSLGKSVKQSDSTLWLKKTSNGTRGLQFFLDNRSTQPKIRLVGAAF